MKANGSAFANSFEHMFLIFNIFCINNSWYHNTTPMGIFFSKVSFPLQVANFPTTHLYEAQAIQEPA
jgi:hypothetical protein